MATIRPRVHTLLWTSKCQFSCRSTPSARPLSTVSLAFDKYDPPRKQSQDDALNIAAGIAINAPIVFLHGFFGNKKNNRSMSKILARDLNRVVYTLDLRNHGDSPHDRVHDYQHIAADVERFLDEKSLHGSTLIGHSMGAKAAMCVALQSPRKVSSLVAVDNAPVDAALKTDFGTFIQGMQEVERKKLTKQSEADEILSAYAKELPIRQFLLTNLVRSPDNQHLMWRIPLRTLALALDNMSDFPFRNPDEARYEGPTLMVRGTKSPYVPDETLPVIGRFFPRFKLAEIEAGHWVISENPEAFRAAVVEFLSSED